MNDDSEAPRGEALGSRQGVRLSPGLLKKEVEMEWSSGKCSGPSLLLQNIGCLLFVPHRKARLGENGVGAGYMVNIHDGESLPSQCLSPNTKPGDL